MNKITILWVISASVYGQNPLSRQDPFVGTFQQGQVTLELTGTNGSYAGSLTVQGNKLATTVTAAGDRGNGKFQVNGQTYSFTVTPTSSGLKLASDGQEYLLVRNGGTQTTAEQTTSPAEPTAASIVGTWRNATGSARFNADGTGAMDGESGRYEIRGDQLTLIGAKGQITLRFEIRGDTLSLSASTPAPNSAAIILNRVREASGPGSVLAELVGKWCWVSVVTAQQGARQSNQCVTLEANGSYLYAGATDSYNPNGGASSQSSDSGTWSATETTLTARSRSGKTTVYTLEKRNHPKNKDPMIVLNGQTFVTFYNKAPW